MQLRTLLVTMIAPLAAACSMSNSADSGSATTGADGVVPLIVHHTSSGGVRYGAYIQIGNSAPFKALVDTGSSGLRVLPSAVDDSSYASISDALVGFSYHSGVALQGVIATGSVTIGGLTTPDAIPIMKIETVGCVPTDPDCDAAGVSASDYQAFGYDAVLGIGMRNLDTAGEIGNPIAQLDGEPAFAIHAGSFGEDIGDLVIAPDARETARYTTIDLPPLPQSAPLANGAPAWDDRQVPTCVDDVTHAVPYCAGAILDTGSESTQLEWPTYTGALRTWSPGTQVKVAIGNGAHQIAGYDFTVGSTTVPGLDRVEYETRINNTEALINVGTAAFLRYDVLFDQTAGRIGLATHTL